LGFGHGSAGGGFDNRQGPVVDHDGHASSVGSALVVLHRCGLLCSYRLAVRLSSALCGPKRYVRVGGASKENA